MAKENNVISRLLRKRLAQITSGAIGSLSPVKYIALGTGGQDAQGNVLPPPDTQTALREEVGRYEVVVPAYPVETTARYTVTVPESDLVGKGINEIALVAEDGSFYMMRTHLPKFKEDDEEFEFTFDSEF